MGPLEHDNFSAARFEDLLVVRWHGRTNTDAARCAVRLVREFVRDRGVCVLLLIHSDRDPAPTPGGMRVVLGFIPELLRITRYRVALVQGEGFGAAVIHAAYGRISLLSRFQTLFIEREVSAALRHVAGAADMTVAELTRELHEHGLLLAGMRSAG